MNFRDLLVIETGPGMAGPLVTRTLRDLGARVLKIESTTRMDFGKSRLPPPGKSAEDVLYSPGVLEMSGGKESVTLNLKTDDGRDLFLQLLDRADVYVESYAPGWLERLGLSLEMFLERNPRLVIISQSAYGSEGPKRDQRAYAPLMTAAAGVESITGYEDGRIVPQIVSAVGDIVAANFGTLLAMSGLYQRERTGAGIIYDMSQIEASATMAGIAIAEYGLTGEVPGPRGNTHPGLAPHGIYRTAGDDDWIALSVVTDDDWASAAGVLGISEDERVGWTRVEDRVASQAKVDALVERYTSKFDQVELCERLQAVGVPAAPVLDIYDVDDHPAHVDRQLWTAFDHPKIGELRMTEIPWTFDHLELRRRAWAEDTGASTDVVLRDLCAASDAQIAEWRAVGALE